MKRGGAVVIPAFAVGRTQTLMYYLRQLESAQRIPRLPVYVDSPMAINVTGLYENHHEDHDLEFTKEEPDGNHDPLNVHEVHMTRTVEDSKKINDVVSPCIIISASGMATGGRILHHLARRLPDSRSSVLLVGYQAEGSRGRANAGRREVFVASSASKCRCGRAWSRLGSFRRTRAKVSCCDGSQGSKLRRGRRFWCTASRSRSNALRAAVTAQFHWPVTIPAYQQSFDLAL